MDHKIILPLYVIIPRKKKDDKKIIINLNNYPHWHFMTYNAVKKLFKEAVMDQIINLRLDGKIELEYTLFKGSERISDKMNVLAVQDKFFCDALTELGCIKDDNDSVIIKQTFNETKIDKNNPRVEVVIKQI